MIPERIYIDVDSADRAEIFSLTSLVLRNEGTLVERPSSETMNFSSYEIFRALDKSECPQWCFFEISLLRKLLRGESVTDLEDYVINPGEYNGKQYSEADHTLLTAVTRQPQSDTTQQYRPEKQPTASRAPNEYSVLEEAFVLTAMMHHEALLYPRTVVHMCIKHTIDAYSSSRPDMSVRSYTSIKEKFKQLDLKMASLSPVRLAMLKLPLLDHPEILRTFLQFLKQYAEGKLPDDPSMPQKPIKVLTKKDAQVMYNAACWEYPPGTDNRAIADDFQAYFGRVHRGREIKDDTWPVFFRRNLVQKAGGRAFIGKFYADLTSAGLAPSSIKGANARQNSLLTDIAQTTAQTDMVQTTMAQTNTAQTTRAQATTARSTTAQTTTPNVVKSPKAVKSSHLRQDKNPSSREITTARGRWHAGNPRVENSRNASSEEEDEGDDTFDEMFRDDVRPKKRQRTGV